MKIFWQRDPRIKDIILGTSSLTLGQAGCTLGCVGKHADLSIEDVNERLNKVGGFAVPANDPKEKNLIIWAKIKEAIPWLEFEWRGYAYENERVLEAIKNYGGCLVEVDAKRIGATRHWVYYLGNQKMYDPWYGNEKITSYYPPIGYAIIKRIGNPPSNNSSNTNPYSEIFKKYGYDENPPAESVEVIVSKFVEWRDKLQKGELLTKEECEQKTKAIKTLYEMGENSRKKLSLILYNETEHDFTKIVLGVNEIIDEADTNRKAAKFAHQWFDFFNKERSNTYTYPDDLEALFTASQELVASWKDAFDKKKAKEVSENKEEIISGEQKEQISFLQQIWSFLKKLFLKEVSNNEKTRL